MNDIIFEAVNNKGKVLELIKDTLESFDRIRLRIYANKLYSYFTFDSIEQLDRLIVSLQSISRELHKQKVTNVIQRVDFEGE